MKWTVLRMWTPRRGSPRVTLVSQSLTISALNSLDTRLLELARVLANAVPSACISVRLCFLRWKVCANACLHLAPKSLRSVLLQKSLSLLNQLGPSLLITHD